jgi:hypothetical protein
MEGKWTDYFAFSRKERIGIYTLLILIVVSMAAPRFFSSPSLKSELTAEAILLEKAQPAPPEKEFTPRLTYGRTTNTRVPATLFPFDPNTLDASGWKKLGLPDRTVRTILNYRNKGGRFRNTADLQKMYGLKQADF